MRLQHSLLFFLLLSKCLTLWSIQCILLQQTGETLEGLITLHLTSLPCTVSFEAIGMFRERNIFAYLMTHSTGVVPQHEAITFRTAAVRLIVFHFSRQPSMLPLNKYENELCFIPLRITAESGCWWYLAGVGTRLIPYFSTRSVKFRTIFSIPNVYFRI